MKLFRPSLNYPTYPYAEMLVRTAGRFPENVAVVSKDVNLTYRELDALTNSFTNALPNVVRLPFLQSWYVTFRNARISPLFLPMA